MMTVRQALERLDGHLQYVGRLAEARRWLAGEEVSLADIAAAAHLSCLDYLGDVAWRNHPEAKEWYVRLKSRPSFRPLLADLVPGLPPPRHYADLDF
jgi:glutathione S-transferase